MIVVEIALYTVLVFYNQVNGEYQYGFQRAVLDYPLRLRELFPDGIIQSALDLYVPSNGLSQKCKKDSKFYLEGLKEFQPWAVKMLDASSKLPSGIMHGHLQDLGNYDECLHIDLKSPFETQYCMVHFPGIVPIAKFGQQNLTVITGGLPVLYPEVVISLCLPASCSLEDLEIHYSNLVEKFNATASLDKYGCSTRSLVEMDTLDLIAIAFVIILLTIVLASTLYEIITEYNQPKNDKSERSLLKKLLISFSLINNGKCILTTTNCDRSFSFMNGLRFISISWILMGHHIFLNTIFLPSLNSIEVLEAFPKVYTSWIISSALSVDTFFVMSGCLLTYFFFVINKDGKTTDFNFLTYYLHRLIRIVPTLLTTVLLSATLFNYIGDGPLWNNFTIRHKEYCRKNWWINLLFLNNYINIEEQCAVFTWFLCVDMQLYILSPLVLLPMRKYKSVAYTIIPLCIIASMANSFFLSYINELPAGQIYSRDLRVNTTAAFQYTKAHIRIGPWLVGMILGHILYNLRSRKFYMSKVTVTCGWTLAITANLMIVYSVSYFYQDDYEYERILSSLYTAVHRTVWAIGIAWLIFACETGYGGFLQRFLSWSLFQPLGKLTFTMYMVHSACQFYMIATARGSAYFSFSTLSRNIFGEMFITILLAFGESLIIEVPFRKLETIILKDLKTLGNKSERQQEQQLTLQHQIEGEKCLDMS